MRNSDVLATSGSTQIAQTARQKRKVAQTIWQPFLQYKLLMNLLGSSVLVAIILGAFLLYALSDMIGIIGAQGGAKNYYEEMIGKEMINIFRYCGALFLLYMILLAAICITYTHKVISPLKPISRHIDALNAGDYQHRMMLRKKDLPLIKEHAEKLNALAATLEKQKQKQSL